MKAGASNSVQPRFLMCHPQHFSVSYAINPWMNPHAWATTDLALSEAAQRQWATFHATLLNRGAAIEFVDLNRVFPT